jgi:anti-sigma regulatory factor (Ser/Thr protein kinase)
VKIESLIDIDADLTALADVREFILQEAKPLGFDETALYDLQLAVDEAVTNIIIHGYQNKGGDIGIRVMTDDGTFIVCITDHAPPFDPTTIETPPADLNLPPMERAPGGAGVYLIRKGMDSMSYRYTPDNRNELTLVKTIS